MPKRAELVQSHNRRFNPRNYDEHDDRDRQPTDIQIRKNKGGNRRVSFKPSKLSSIAKNNVKSRTAEMGLRTHFEEDDEMIEFENSRNKASTFRRRNSPVPRSARNNRAKQLVESASGWFLVTIPHGNKYEKDFILKALLSAITPEIFIPHYWKVESTAVSFFVDDLKMARLLSNADRTIEMPNGFKMIIKVRNGVPPLQLDVRVKEQMKLAMVKRYTAPNKAMDLTKFHADPDLQDVFCGLFRPPIMLAVIDIIAENIPDLEALNLDNNKIQSLDHFKCLATKLPNLKILYMANNKIGSPASLEPLKNANIVDLVLKGNPIRERFRDEAIYIREVRKRLPNLKKLDGVDLPAQIGFDIQEDEAKVPPAQASFLIDQAGADIVRQFLEQYFLIFDSDNRQPLLEAYHADAMFSMSCTYHPNPDFRLTKYLPYNRNLLRLRESDRKIQLLKCGRLPVVSFLSEMPQTEHDPRSFAVDLTLFTPSMILLTVTGIFREKSNAPVAGRNDLRSFHRSLVIVPMGAGFCIKNDMLHINTLTMAQLKTAFKPIAPVPVTTGPIQAPVVPTPTSALQQTSPPDEATKMQMIQAISQMSQMNADWSRRCLEETNWNFQQASHAFTELQKQNKIPPEAFVK